MSNSGFLKQSRPEWKNLPPECYAAKLAEARNLSPALVEQMKEQPRLPEMIFFIQAMGMQPGGLKKFCEDFLEENLHRLAPLEILGLPEGKPMPKATVLRLTRKFPWLVPTYRQQRSAWSNGRVYSSTSEDDEPCDVEAFVWSRALMLENTHSHARLWFYPEMRRCLEDKTTGLFVPKYFPLFHTALLERMAAHASQAERLIARTEITKMMYDALDYALAEKILVRIDGTTRTGKTESAKAWCEARPGLARLVTVPPSNTERDFFASMADALGIDYTMTETARTLRQRVEYVMTHSQLMLIWDEFHFALPTTFTASTTPHRLNWIRANLVDKGIPCAAIVTPQSYADAVRRYLRKTGYSFDQWLGRVKRHLELPEELSDEDMLAVARLHFPSLSASHLKLIVAKAMQSPGYLNTMDGIARRARYLATQDNRRDRVMMADIEKAIADTVRVAQPPARSTPAAPLPKPRRTPAKPAPQLQSDRADLSGDDDPTQPAPRFDVAGTTANAGV